MHSCLWTPFYLAVAEMVPVTFIWQLLLAAHYSEFCPILTQACQSFHFVMSSV